MTTNLSFAPLIPRSVLFGNPHRTSPEISPDGTLLAYLAPDDNGLNVQVGPLDGSSEPVSVTHESGRGVPAFGFCHDDRSLVYMADTDGDERWRLHRVDLMTGQIDCLTPFPGVRTQILAHNRWHPDTMILGLNRAGAALQDLFRLDLGTGMLELIATNPGYASWLVDSDLAVRGGLDLGSDGALIIHLDESSESGGRPWRTIPPAEVSGTEVLGFTRRGDELLLVSAENADTSRLLAVDVVSGRERVLACRPGSDVVRVELDPATLLPQAAVFAGDRDHWVYLDEQFGREVGGLRTALAETGLDGELSIGRSERTGRLWTVSVLPSDGSLRYHLYDSATGGPLTLFDHNPDLRNYRLAPMEPFATQARDGIRLSGYVTFPPGMARDRLPAVLLVHGGPWARDVWGYDPQVQWLANRGYLCVQVNFRGSTGFGKAFSALGNKEWGRAMQFDLLDAIEFCTRQGWADPDRIAVMGLSYGGYAALAGVAFSPGTFRCAVDVCGPSNLLTMLESVPAHWKPAMRLMHDRVGDPRTEREMLWSRSPLSQVDAIGVPLLLAHGANDPRVLRSESERIVAALRARAIPHRYLLFEDEGHSLADPRNRERFYSEAEAFLADHLGGRDENSSDS